MTYNNLASSAIKTLNYLFLRYTFKREIADQSGIILEEFQNYLHAFASGTLLHSDEDLKEILRTELIEGDYCKKLTKREAFDHYNISISNTYSERYDLADYFVSLLDDEDYASQLIEKPFETILDRNDEPVLPNTMIVFDQSISKEPILYLVRQIGNELYIKQDDDRPFVNLSSMFNVFRIAIPEDNPDYIEGYGCPRCFSDDTTTLVASRENTCNRCGHKFPLPEEEARSMEDENTKYSLCQLTLDAQVKAYIDFLRFAEDMGHDHSHTFTEFQETSNLNSWEYSPAGQLV